MIIDYDHNPALTDEQRLQSLVESIILAFGEIQTMLSQQQKQIDIIVKTIGTVSDDISGIRSDITTMQGNITTINGKITALEAVAADAILQSTAS